VAIYEAGVITQAPTATADKPYCGLWNTTGGSRLRLLELGMCNTAATTSKVAIKRTTARGTQTGTLLGTPLDSNDAATLGTVDFTYSADPTVTGNYFRRGHIANVIGASLLWSWWNSPLVIAPALGIALVVPTAAAGAALEVWFVWES
jgi:hypothetical protein